MKTNQEPNHTEARQRVDAAYHSEKPRFLARLRKMGRGWEEAEDLLHDVYAETLERLPLLGGIRNLPAWIQSLFTRRLIDAWRHDQVRLAVGEVAVAEETLEQIISGAGLDPLDEYVRDCLMDALNDALQALPPEQRRVVEAQVFKGQTFRQISEATGVGIDTLTARKRYALQSLSKALRHWIEE